MPPARPPPCSLHPRLQKSTRPTTCATHAQSACYGPSSPSSLPSSTWCASSSRTGSGTAWTPRRLDTSVCSTTASGTGCPGTWPVKAASPSSAPSHPVRSRPLPSSSACPWCWSSPASAASRSSSSAAPVPFTRSAAGCSWLQVGDPDYRWKVQWLVVKVVCVWHQTIAWKSPVLCLNFRLLQTWIGFKTADGSECAQTASEHPDVFPPFQVTDSHWCSFEVCWNYLELKASYSTSTFFTSRCLKWQISSSPLYLSVLSVVILHENRWSK